MNSRIVPRVIESLSITQSDMINIMPTFENEYKVKDEEKDEVAKGEYTLRQVAS